MKTIQFNSFSTSFGENSTNDISGDRVSSEDMATLKKALVGVFNETFSKQLLATTQDQSNAEKGFVDALLRRIKRLIQFVPV